MDTKTQMRIENGHAHAKTSYQVLRLRDYFWLLINCLETKLCNYSSLNVHLPFEIQHPKHYPNLKNGLMFIMFGEKLKKILNIKLYWENAPEENFGKWNLKHGQTEWRYVPKNIDLCLDIGHAILGFKTKLKAKNNIEKLIEKRGSQIKHLHIHVNDLKSDQHINNPKKVTEKLSEEWMENIKNNRSYIYEKGE